MVSEPPLVLFFLCKMSSVAPNSTSSEVNSSSTGSCLSPIDSNPSLIITTHKLNGLNFLQWSQSVKLFIQEKGKFGYLTGAVPMPDPKDPAYPTWEYENSLIMSWLVNSMEPTIGKTYLFLSSAQALCESVKEMYSDVGNSAQLFEIKNLISETRQGSHPVTQYYNQLIGLWHECDLFSDFKWHCSTNQLNYQKMQNTEQVFDFLAGLNKELDDVRGCILGRVPLPNFREVFNKVRREESRCNIMLNHPSQHAAPVNESSALVSKSGDSSWPSTPPSRYNGRPWCDHCN